MRSLLFSLFVLLTIFNVEARDNNLSKKLVGRWVFKSVAAEQLDVKRKTLKDSIETDITNKKGRFDGQGVEFKSDGTFVPISKFSDGKDYQGKYTLNGDQLSLFFMSTPVIETIKISGNTLIMYSDETEFYQDYFPLLLETTDNSNSILKVVTKRIYEKK